MLKVQEILKLDDKAIDAKIAACRKELFAIRIQLSTSGVEKPHRLNELKKDVARLLTVKTQKGK